MSDETEAHYQETQALIDDAGQDDAPEVRAITRGVQTAIAPQMVSASARTMRERVNAVQEVMKSVMKEGTHYGTIPGAGPKPTLLKPGSEVLLMAFQIAVTPEVEDLSSEDERRYRVRAAFSLQKDQSLLGVGIGECSSQEEKYNWRAAVCDEEFEATPETRRRIKWKKGFNGRPAEQIKQVRTNPADVANTVLKMAKKRAQIDGTLTVCAASDIFTQDVEDMPAEMLGGGRGAPADPKPAASNGNGGGMQPKPKTNGSNANAFRARVVDVVEKSFIRNDEKKFFWIVQFQGAPEATTFDTKIRDLALDAKELGGMVDVEVSRTPKTKGDGENIRIEKFNPIPEAAAA